MIYIIMIVIYIYICYMHSAKVAVSSTFQLRQTRSGSCWVEAAFRVVRVATWCHQRYFEQQLCGMYAY